MSSVSPQRLYREDYEKTKAKNHIPPDMLEILSARNTQSTVSGIHYRKYLHQWICLPDMQVYTQARKVNEQLSDVSVPASFFNWHVVAVLKRLMQCKVSL